MRTSLGHKIQTEHLERRALIYVRQSTLTQVRKNVGSKARQYDLVQRARDLGWAKDQIVRTRPGREPVQKDGMGFSSWWQKWDWGRQERCLCCILFQTAI